MHGKVMKYKKFYDYPNLTIACIATIMLTKQKINKIIEWKHINSHPHFKVSKNGVMLHLV